MLVRRYRGKDLREALAHAKAELGEEATVMATRKVRRGLMRRKELELTVALAPVLGPPPVIGAQTVPGGSGGKQQTPNVKAREARKAPVPQIIAGKSGVDAGYVARAMAPLRSDVLRLREELRVLAEGVSDQRDQTTHLINEQMQLMTGQLVRILGEIGEDGEAGDIEDIGTRQPQPFDQLEHKLRRSGMSSATARDLLAAVRALASQYGDREVSPELLAAEQIEQRLRYTFPLETHAKRPAALVGPGGAGKTTTLAKIVTRAALLHDKPVAIVGYDTQGIGAAEGVKVLAQTVGVPWRIARNARLLARDVDALSREYLVFVDTTGLSPRAACQLSNLGEALATAGVEAHLVLSAGLRDVEIESMVRAYSSLEPRSLTVTKVDQAIGLGGIYDAAMLSGLPLMYLGTGRRVPEDMQEATPQRAASLILGMQYN